MNYYIYYRIPAERLESVRRGVQAMFDAIEKASGIRGRWEHRTDDPSTYMEVFEGVKDPAAFDALLEREGAKLGLKRIVERFISAEKPA